MEWSILISRVLDFRNSQQLEPKVLPRPQASLLGQARCSLGYGIDRTRFARRFGIGANENQQPSCRNLLFSRHTAFYRTALGTRLPKVFLIQSTFLPSISRTDFRFTWRLEEFGMPLYEKSVWSSSVSFPIFIYQILFLCWFPTRPYRVIHYV